jgi:hypothetical protein
MFVHHFRLALEIVLRFEFVLDSRYYLGEPRLFLFGLRYLLNLDFYTLLRLLLLLLAKDLVLIRVIFWHSPEKEVTSPLYLHLKVSYRVQPLDSCLNVFGKVHKGVLSIAEELIIDSLVDHKVVSVVVRFMLLL